MWAFKKEGSRHASVKQMYRTYLSDGVACMNNFFLLHQLFIKALHNHVCWLTCLLLHLEINIVEFLQV